MKSDFPFGAYGETVASLFQADTLISDQYFATLHRKTHLEPEKRIMLAVLEDGVACFQKHIFARNGKRKALFREAEDWFLEENSDQLFSFESICEAFEINPKYLRKGLLQWKQMRLKEGLKTKIDCLNPRQKEEEG